MINSESSFSNAWPLIPYFILVIVLTTLIIGLSYLLGERHHGHSTDLPYESGVASFGSSHLRLSAKFYLIALFFVIFDLEAIFFYAWAISLYEVGWAGYVEILIFSLVLFLALIYLWRRGALDWSPKHAR